jgi:hypothetical protein
MVKSNAVYGIFYKLGVGNQFTFVSYFSQTLSMQHTETKLTMQDLVCKTNYARDVVVGRMQQSRILFN